MKDHEGLGALYKQKYCLGENIECGRYTVFKKPGKPAVPEDLYPNMYELSRKIMAGKYVVLKQHAARPALRLTQVYSAMRMHGPPLKIVF
jgi:hypothetical protein